MESSVRFRPCSHHHSCHHHRHHHHPQCHYRHHQFLSLHRHCDCHFLLRPSFCRPPLQDPKPAFHHPSQTGLNMRAKETPVSVAQVLQEPEHHELDDKYEEEDDPVFVLTDEWREFFAKSEAKRKLEKQLAKRKDRH